MSLTPQQVREAMRDVRNAVNQTAFDETALAVARTQLDQLVMAYRAEGISDLFTGAACLMALISDGIPTELGVIIIAAMEGIR